MRVNSTVALIAGTVLIIVGVVFLFLMVKGLGNLRTANHTKKFIGMVVLAALACLVWLGWEFQPWMSSGRAVHISSSHLGQYDFQVWQRKNDSVTEPFATGLFARKQSGQWQVFMLDFEDTYRPSIDLRMEGSGVVILKENEKLGLFDITEQVFKRTSDGASFPGAALTSEPPGNWWLKQDTQSSAPLERK